MPGPQIQASRADRNIRPWPTVCTHGAVIFRRKLQFLQFGGTCTITGGHLTPSTIPRNVSYSEPVSYPQRLATYAAPSKSHQVNRHSKKPKVHTLLFNVRRAINNVLFHSDDHFCPYSGDPRTHFHAGPTERFRLRHIVTARETLNFGRETQFLNFGGACTKTGGYLGPRIYTT